MNAEKGIKHQQRRLFIGQLLSFAGLFVVLGIIVFSYMSAQFIKTLITP
ncbi:hypothetical protein LCA32G_1038 [Lacticaseibacillus paracasei]|nr:hypothetical protein LCA32G_1038 [Lacticaseibacillus paracasei]EKQ04082.1 hypothetical protein LCA211_0698 [Lacticaseibacillus casei 21/1]EKQ08598.1 hypothetical protein LCACRF28_0815 [Lacticaseibacillus paracasei]EKQ24182.1 hypothetical protein LCAUW1_0682 [Lacticaseibacillus paracasei]